MKYLRIVFLILLVVFCNGCRKSRSIHCFDVDEQKLCFVRKVWGFNGDEVSLTTNTNVCRNSSKESDFISNSMRSSELIYYKVTNEKLYIYSESMDLPMKQFPIEVFIEPYDPTKPDKNLSLEGYQEADLSYDKMTWCITDFF